MALKELLVYLDGSDRSEARLTLAVGLARQHGSRLTGLCVTDPSYPLAIRTGQARQSDPATLDLLVKRARQEQRDHAAGIERGFRERTERAGIQASWRLLEGEVARTVAAQARSADLVVVGQPNPDDPGADGEDELVERALISAGCPILLAPFMGRFDGGVRTVLVAWKSTRESARAVRDALPLIEKAQSVRVLTIGGRLGGGERDVPSGADIAAYLTRHGVAATALETERQGTSVADTLLNHAADMGADLLVMGGYGHSRLRELVLGGVTRDILRHMTIPVLMSH
ncbi:universal stress protein [Roseicella aerolata]|uniref:Universal stress protein n=1 Tax=Roseicella aerolata TaxID=2883479 RepID=A0A9X1IEB8_9PROT|nr:universal stress protein [Roseicella aerolata]MCB4822524.1 universal stress protein [Roseicella aerolata]